MHMQNVKMLNLFFLSMLSVKATCFHVRLPGKYSCVNANRSVVGEEALPTPHCLFFGFIFRVFFIVDICALHWRSV